MRPPTDPRKGRDSEQLILRFRREVIRKAGRTAIHEVTTRLRSALLLSATIAADGTGKSLPRRKDAYYDRTGTYTNPATAKAIVLKATLLQQIGQGGGYVLSTNHSAPVGFFFP